MPAVGEDKSESHNRRGLRTAQRVAFVAVPAAFVALLAVGVLRSQPRSIVGAELPEFSLPQPVPGAPQVTSDDLRGNPAVINFFASWCIPCRVEAPLLERTWHAYKDQGLVVLGVNILDTEEDVLDFINRFRITFPVVRDTNEELANQFGVTGIPETFFVDHNWRFAAIGPRVQIGSRGKTVVYGAISPALLRSQVELLLGKRNKESPTVPSPAP